VVLSNHKPEDGAALRNDTAEIVCDIRQHPDKHNRKRDSFRKLEQQEGIPVIGSGANEQLETVCKICAAASLAKPLCRKVPSNHD
jgi:hypothetical protein